MFVILEAVYCSKVLPVVNVGSPEMYADGIAVYRFPPLRAKVKLGVATLSTYID